jgi:hypothetical protein
MAKEAPSHRIGIDGRHILSGGGTAGTSRKVAAAGEGAAGSRDVVRQYFGGPPADEFSERIF